MASGLPPEGGLKLRHEGPVAVLVIDRPAQRNALDRAACIALGDAVSAAVGAGARALVLGGEGPHFCAGADLSAGDLSAGDLSAGDLSAGDLSAGDLSAGAGEEGHFVGALYAALEVLTNVPIPTIAAVQGAALGAGAQLAVACDLRVATPNARFGVPAARLGLMVDHWTIERLALMAGFGPARAMLLAAEEYSGADAHRLGLVQRLGDLDDAIGWAHELASLAPLTIAGHKLGLNLLERAAGGESLFRDAFRRAWASEDLREGMAARVAKRRPEFRGR